MNLPLLNACLNGLSGILLIVGLRFILRGNKQAHQRCMVAAFAVSCLFLCSYLYHKIVVVKGINTPFRGPASWRLISVSMRIRRAFSS